MLTLIYIYKINTHTNTGGESSRAFDTEEAAAEAAHREAVADSSSPFMQPAMAATASTQESASACCGERGEEG